MSRRFTFASKRTFSFTKICTSFPLATSCPESAGQSVCLQYPARPIFRFGTRPSTDRAVRVLPTRYRDHNRGPRLWWSAIRARYRSGLFQEHRLLLELAGDTHVVISSLLSPARRPRYRESCLVVFPYVPSIRLSLGFPSPKAPHEKHAIWQVEVSHDLQPHKNAAPPVRPIPTHILRPRNPPFPRIELIRPPYPPESHLRSSRRYATTERRTSRRSPRRSSNSMVRTPPMPI